jgi:hypothetical protein
MSELVNSVAGDRLAGEVDGALELRLWRTMIAMVALAVVAGVALAPWRVTTGLLLGGLLSLLNHHWLCSSVAAVFDVGKTGKRPRVKISRYIFRYFVVGGVVFAAYKLQMVSLPATIAGLCSFAVALFVEAFRQFYLVIVRREETY